MPRPTSQQIALWVIDGLDEPTWCSISQAIYRALESALNGVSSGTLLEWSEIEEQFVSIILRDHRDRLIEDGAAVHYEVDLENNLIRGQKFPHFALLRRIREMNPFKFEELCAKILGAMGAEAFATPPVNDGGVDFVGMLLRPVPIGYALPRKSSVTVIGQAKRYARGKNVCLNELRQFVGAARKYRDHMRGNNNFGVLSPVLLAYWTTSEFDESALQFAREMGIWTLEGATLCEYVLSLNLEGEVPQLSEQTDLANDNELMQTENTGA